MLTTKSSSVWNQLEKKPVNAPLLKKVENKSYSTKIQQHTLPKPNGTVLINKR